MSRPPVTVDDLLRQTRARLRDAGLPTAALDARLLVAHALGWSPVRLVADGASTPDPAALSAVEALTARRLAGEPVGRILGRREFHGLDLHLGPDTLEPRPDTEILVDAALAAVRRGAVPGAAADGEGLLLVDVGTGTGAIALAMLAALPKARAVAVDLSAGALAVAAANAERLGLADRLDARLGSYLDQVFEPVTMVLSNPPYIESDAIAGLDREVRDHDPRLALDGGPDGLDAYRALGPAAYARLLPGGTIGLEIGSGQASAVGDGLAAAGFVDIRTILDLAGHDRVVMAVKPAADTGR
ncbi:peptide chain release factor N(5)-glutamine methyltransferase [Mongoliimonas terrestris]|uniref:peptide chain release factor N(5)-glutamine methyltransferase n=1 Tax=Mongoliimonas terrestris TaxID=1709001 RepID=UPI0009495BDB|nr:peptide chain release factor N(5)-glutamine methyltransferase [Mongoliimonas terrestris]